MMLMTGISVYRGTVITLAVAWFYVYPSYLCSIRNINGPHPTSLFFGNVIELFTKVSCTVILPAFLRKGLLLVQPALHPPTDRCLVFGIIILPWHVYVTHIVTPSLTRTPVFSSSNGLMRSVASSGYNGRSGKAVYISQTQLPFIMSLSPHATRILSLISFVI